MSRDRNICECGHHRAVHHPKCAPWSDPRACSCEKFRHVPNAEPGKDVRVEDFARLLTR